MYTVARNVSERSVVQRIITLRMARWRIDESLCTGCGFVQPDSVRYMQSGTDRKVACIMNKRYSGLCGVGGQGTVLASKLIASAYMAKGETVHSAETIGMAQRGGSVTSHVRIGEAYSPLIAQGGADIILAFEPAEAVRNLAYLKKGRNRHRQQRPGEAGYSIAHEYRL